MLLSCEEVEAKLKARQHARDVIIEAYMSGLDQLCEALEESADPKTHLVYSQVEFTLEHDTCVESYNTVEISQASWNGYTQEFGVFVWNAHERLVVMFEKENVTVEEVRQALRKKIYNKFEFQFKPEELGPWWDKMYRLQQQMEKLRKENRDWYIKHGWSPLADFEFEYRRPV